VTGLTREYSDRTPAWEQQGDSQQAADGGSLGAAGRQPVGGSQSAAGSHQAAASGREAANRRQTVGSWLLPRCTLATTACRLLAASLLHPGRRHADSERIRPATKILQRR
jgi:hypothetical protein